MLANNIISVGEFQNNKTIQNIKILIWMSKNRLCSLWLSKQEVVAFLLPPFLIMDLIKQSSLFVLCFIGVLLHNKLSLVKQEQEEGVGIHCLRQVL